MEMSWANKGQTIKHWGSCASSSFAVARSCKNFNTSYNTETHETYVSPTTLPCEHVCWNFRKTRAPLLHERHWNRRQTRWFERPIQTLPGCGEKDADSENKNLRFFVVSSAFRVPPSGQKGLHVKMDFRKWHIHHGNWKFMEFPS